MLCVYVCPISPPLSLPPFSSTLSFPPLSLSLPLPSLPLTLLPCPLNPQPVFLSSHSPFSSSPTSLTFSNSHSLLPYPQPVILPTHSPFQPPFLPLPCASLLPPSQSPSQAATTQQEHQSFMTSPCLPSFPHYPGVTSDVSFLLLSRLPSRPRSLSPFILLFTSILPSSFFFVIFSHFSST